MNEREIQMDLGTQSRGSRSFNGLAARFLAKFAQRSASTTMFPILSPFCNKQPRNILGEHFFLHLHSYLNRYVIT